MIHRILPGAIYSDSIYNMPNHQDVFSEGYLPQAQSMLDALVSELN
jgi:hypothetical protein